ncbi:hypothetical protein BURK1_03151 [Burkholderiales bacterium]|nr:hypothetical protein BURK1_03151 [Burkholderiales bacterium]
MTTRDARGLPLSTASEDAAESYERAFALLLGSRHEALDAVERTLARHGDFAMGHALRSAILVLGWDEPRERELAAAIAAIDALGAGATARERRHADAARAWLAGEHRRAAAAYGAIVADHPRDLLALAVAHSLDFRAGRRAAMIDGVARALPHWDERVPGYGHVLALHAFALEENGDFVRAEAQARRSLVHAPGNPSAIHAVAHVMEMQGRPQEGVAWLGSTGPSWAIANGYAVHLAWHLALFHLDLDDAAQARSILDRRIDVGSDRPMSALVDASALLWRLRLRGFDDGGRSLRLADRWERKPLEGARAFNLVHAMIAFVAAGHRAGVRRVIAALGRQAQDPETRDDVRLALPICTSFEQFAAGDYASALRGLTQLRHLASRCGGSVAQCDLIHLTLIESALRSQHAKLAGALAEERAARRPGSRLNRWLAARIGLALRAA